VTDLKSVKTQKRSPSVLPHQIDQKEAEPIKAMKDKPKEEQEVKVRF